VNNRQAAGIMNESILNIFHGFSFKLQENPETRVRKSMSGCADLYSR
jgi:hypothetical protein